MSKTNSTNQTNPESAQRRFYNEVYVARTPKEYERVLSALRNLKVDFHTMPSSLNIEYDRT